MTCSADKKLTDDGKCECLKGYNGASGECLECHITCKTCIGPEKN